MSLKETYLDLLDPEEQDEAIIADLFKSLEKRLAKFRVGVEEYIANLQSSLQTGLKNTAKDEIRKAKAEVSRISLQAQANAFSDIRELVDGIKQEIKEAEKRLKVTYETKEDTTSALNRFAALKKEIETTVKKFESSFEDHKEDWGLFREEIEDIKTELREKFLTLLNRPTHGGGNMNRNIAVGGNPSVLSRYTDINLKAGTNVTLTYANNDTTKYTDITVAATGGGGGTVRSINNIAADTAAGDTAGTDYVYLAAGTLTLTLPTAVGNTNLYTVKNTGAGLVTIATTGGETIDGNAGIEMATQFTSVDLISNSMNWAIT